MKRNFQKKKNTEKIHPKFPASKIIMLKIKKKLFFPNSVGFSTFKKK